MKKSSLLLLLSLMWLSGCAGNPALVTADSTSPGSGIFKELTNGGPAPSGFTDLHITATLKTHKPGLYSAADVHGTPDYTLLLNIDGQAVLLYGSLQKENSESRGLADPEAGDGIRYRFSKNLRLKAGSHRIKVALPDDGISVEREISLAEGNRNHLGLEPIYSTTTGKKLPGGFGTASFKEGIRGIGLTLDGRDI